MTWAEFQLRKLAYFRIQEKEALLFREVAYASLTGSHYNPKKLPKSKDKFWQIGHKKPSSKKGIKEAILRAQEEFFKQQKELNG